MLASTPIPDGGRPYDLSLVRHRGTDLVVCVTGGGRAWSWAPATGVWTRHDLDVAHVDFFDLDGCPDAENLLDSCAAASVGGRLLLAAGGDEWPPAIWDLATGGILVEEAETSGYTIDVAAYGGRFFTAEAFVDVVHEWTPEARGRRILETARVHTLSLGRLGGRDVLLVTGDRALVLAAGTCAELASYEVGERFMGLAAADGSVVGVTQQDRLYAWDFASGSAVFGPVEVPPGRCHRVEVVGGLAVTADEDDGLCLWRLADGAAAGRIEVPGHQVRATEVGGRSVLITGGVDGVVRLWEERDLRAA